MVSKNTMNEILGKVDLIISDFDFIEKCLNLRSSDEDVQAVELHYVSDSGNCFWKIEIIYFNFFNSEEDFISYLKKIKLPHNRIQQNRGVYEFKINNCSFEFFKTENPTMKKNYNSKKYS